MNAQRTFSAIRRIFALLPAVLAPRLLPVSLAAVLLALVPLASQAGKTPALHGGSGAVLALAAQLRASHILDNSNFRNARTTPSGRSLLNPLFMHSGALRSHAASGVVPIPGASQTYDVFNPAPAFRPLLGYQNGDGSLGNTPANPPVYASTLAPTNLTPIWSQDETFLVYSSNRTATGTVAADGRFHLWAISVNGGESYQITTSTGPAGGGEFFPSLISSNNTELAFTSDAQTPGVQNLYAIQFSLNLVVNGTIGNISDPAFVTSPTNIAGTGFDQVQRPTISPANSNLIVFAAHSTAGTYSGHYHLYFLYLTTGGYDPSNTTLPAKLTDGPADDTDPAYSNDGQFIAFASTATQVNNQTAPNNVFSSNPNTSQAITTAANGTTVISNRSLFLLSGGVGASAFGTVPSGLQSVHGRMTQAGTDDFGPAWSYVTPNQYTNLGIGFEYLAFARGASQGQPHDIYYIQSVRGTNSQGETGKSYEAATTPEPTSTAMYQIAAGGTGTSPYIGNINPNTNQPFFAGGIATLNPGPVNQTADPTTPASVYASYLLGTTAVANNPADQFTCTLPNLTPSAVYTVKLHFAEPTDVAGKRVFTVNINNGQYLNTVDIAQLAGGANKAYVLTIPNITATNTITPAALQGQIKIVFAKAVPPQGVTYDEPLVNGIEVYSSTAAAGSSGFGGFAGQSQPGSPTTLTAIASANGSVTLNWSPVANAAGYNIYRTPSGYPTQENQSNNGGSGLEGNVAYQSGIVGTIFTDPNLVPGDEYFYQVTALVVQSLTPETVSAGGNAAIKLITENNPPDPTNLYDDVYPSWSPFHSIFSITYSSNRSVSYNHPVSGNPSETAISLPRGLNDSAGPYTVGANYAGILISQVLNLDPPTLLRFSSTETIHVQPGNTADPVGGTPTKYGLVTGGQQITLTVRLSDREAGIDDNNVYLQIKDPDSKYQNSQNLEHKVFAKDYQYSFQTNLQNNDISSFSSNNYLSIDGPGDLGVLTPVIDTWPTYAVGQPEYPRGALGGFWGGTTSHLYVGKSGGGNNQLTGIDTTKGTPPPIAFNFPGDDPNLFIPWGPEYECQYLDAHYSGPDSVFTDYGTPYYLAGVDDQQAYSGVFSPARPEWLQLTKVAANEQDNKGGTLYTATWTTPLSGSDFYLDVIAYDKAVFPNLPANTSPYSGERVNWRIYDNVGGFSTNLSIGNNDILVVSDYALGQKFAGTTFSGSNGNLNLVPKLYGAESYLTDMDVNVLPDTVFAGYPTLITGSAPAWSFGPYLQKFGVGVQLLPPPVYVPPVLYTVPPAPPNQGWHWLNGLGVGSYSDTNTSSYNQGSTVDGAPYDNSQKYSIWRILSRGPVPQQTLSAYLPSKVHQPAVVDLQGPAAYQNIPAATVLDAHRCVIWLSPYTGDLLTDPGALDDPGSFNVSGQPNRQSTQTILRNFVTGGGRLFITGQDVGSGLTLGGTVGNTPGSFLPDVLNAELVSPNGGSNTLVGSANRITGNPGYDGLINGNYPEIVGTYATGFFNNYQVGQPPAYPYLTNLVLGSSSQSDGGLGQRLAPLGLPSGANLLGQIDSITPVNGAQTVMAYNSAAGAAAMVIHDDPYNPAGTGTLPNGGTGSRVVYAAFGLEGLSNDTYSPVGADPTLQESVPPAAPRNPRPNILHNIVTYLRTGSVSGLITQTAGTGAGAGQGVAGVTVYLIPFSGVAPPTRAAFSATTDSGGNFAIAGVEPGVYTLAAYKAGYSRAASNSGIAFTVEGDVNVNGAALTVTPLPPANIAGAVWDTNHVPINGATVIFTSQDNSITKKITTVNGSVSGNPGENYFLASVPVTNYTASATGPLNNQGFSEYIPVTQADAPNASGIVTLANTTTQPVNFTLSISPASLAGTVVDSVTHLPISGATVKLLGPQGGTRAVLTTGADGTYSFANIVATAALANFSVNVTAPHYLTNSVTQPLQAGNVITGLIIPLTATPTGSLTGTVTDQTTHQGLVGATVTFTIPGGVTQTATTVAGGTYTLTGIPTGTYSGTATGPTTGEVYLPSSAQTVTVTTGVTTTANFALVGIPTGGISGTVYDKRTSLPLAGATVTFTPTNPAGGATQTATSGANGVYTLTGIPTGVYSGIATGPTTGQVYLPSAPQSVTVTNGATTTTNTNFLLVPNLSTITGTVTDASTGLPLGGVSISLADTGGNVVTTNPVTITTAADGTYSATFAPGTYTVTAVKSSYTSQTTAATTFAVGATVPVPFRLVSTIGTLGGLVTDAGGASPSVGATVTATLAGQTAGLTFTTSGTATAAPDGGTLNYSGTLVQGTYSVVVSKAGRQTAAQTITIVGGRFNRLDFTNANSLPAVHTFPAGFQFVSTPYDYSSLGFDGIFGALNTAPVGTTPNGNRSHVAVWNPLTDAYALDPTAPADTLHLGIGYWVYLQNPFQLTQQGTAPGGTYVAVSLGKGWNQIGVPNPTKNSAGQYIGVPVSNLMFDDGRGGMITFLQASSSSYNILSPSVPLYGYSNAGGYQAIGAGGTLAAWQGYWIYVNTAATLEIPTT